MSAPLYTRDILRHAASIPHLVPFDKLEGAVERRSPTCGSRVRIAVAIDDRGRVTAMHQAVEACAFGQASAAMMGAHAIGRTAAQVRVAIGRVESWLGGDDMHEDCWPGMTLLEPARSRMARHGAILLPFRALLAAIEDAQ